MCGFTGITHKNIMNIYESYKKRFEESYQFIRDRGPDHKGIWHDENSFFLHARLSIIDIKKTSSQPMELEGHVICYNGEIYNFKSIRNELQKKGYIFKTTGDTEVVLKAWIEWGENMLSRLDGMFSFSIWSKKDKTLFLARDRFGKKPLVYALGTNYLAFSSDIRSLEKIVESGGLNHAAIESLFRFRFIREPMTIFKNFKKLDPGSLLVFNEYGIKIKKWYSPNTIKSIKYDKEMSKTTIKDLVFKAVEKRLISDVPIGLFLSSGLDSGIILAVLSRLGKNIPCYTVGFSENKNYYDESETASNIAKYFGARHEKIMLTSKSILLDIEDILEASDEPFADSSAIPMYSISKSTSNFLKVALTGDGGDEIFGGYRKYISYKWSPLINSIPYIMRKNIAKYLPDTKKNKISDFSRKLKRIIINTEKNLKNMQLNFLDQLSENEYGNLFGKKNHESKNYFYSNKNKYKDKINSILKNDFEFSLLGDMLVKLDRYSMANSIEVRSPFLDKDLVEYVSGLPGKHKIGYFSGKLLIKDAFESTMPKWHMNIAKKGFEVPLDNWLKKELKYLVEEATKNNVIDALPFKNIKIINKWKEDFYNGKRDNSWKLWTLISFSKWANKNNMI